MIPILGYDAAPIGVLGLGRSGLATARALKAGGAVPICWDDGAAARERAAAEGFQVEDLADPPADLAFALYVVSPGIPHLYPAPHPAVAYALRRAIPLDNDIGLFLGALAERGAADAAPRVVAVTGTNGKSTTSALLHHVLRSAGRPAALGGNIGRAVFDLPPPAEDEIIVLEISSYQAELARSLDVDIAVLTNLSPDHLDRHGGLGGYFAAKSRLLAQAGAAIVGVDEIEGLALANRLAPARTPSETALFPDDLAAGPAERFPEAFVVAVSNGAAAAAFPDAVRHVGGRLLARGGESVAEIAFDAAPGLKGEHNAQNAGCAVAACLALGLSLEEIQTGLETFPGLPHRMQTIAEANGVAYVNDSKATNADAAEKALLTFDRIRWVLGGLAKEGGIDRLAPHFARIAKAYLIGASSDAFAATLDAEGVSHERCGDLDAAVERAHAEAQPGETVLLAPAAASFDQFPSFEARGDAFVAAVKRALGTIAQT